MPLNKGCSIGAFRDNISKSIREGKDHSQAVAIAVSTLRSSCMALKKPMPDIGEIVPDEELDESIVEIIKFILAQEKGIERSTDVWGVFDFKPKK